MNCPNCAGTGVSLNPQIFVEWGNPSSGTLPLTTTCECSTKTTTVEVDAAEEMHSPSSDQSSDKKELNR